MTYEDIMWVLEKLDSTVAFASRISGREVSIRCLFKNNHPRGDVHPSASISINNGGESKYCCHMCGVKGTLTHVAWRYTRDVNPFKKAIAVMIEEREKEYIKVGGITEEIYEDIEYKDYTIDYNALPKPDAILREFLIKKGVYTKEFINVFRKLSGGRLGIPYFKDGRCIGFRVRNIWANKQNRQLRYYIHKNYKFRTIELLWGIDRIKTKGDVLYIVEGEFDAAHLLQFNIPAVALGGTTWNKRKENNLLLQVEPRGVIIYLDNDKAGRRETDKIKRDLKEHCFIKTITEKKDPKEVSQWRLLNELQKFKGEIF